MAAEQPARASTGPSCGRSRTAATWSCAGRRTARSPTSRPPASSARTLVHEYGGGMYVGLRWRGRRRERHLQRPGRPAAVPAGSGAGRRSPAGPLERAAADHTGAALRTRPPSRRRARDPGRPAARDGARATRGRRRSGQRARQPARRRLGRASRDRLRTRLLRRPEAQPGRAASGVAQLGPPADAVGRHRAVDGGARRRRHGLRRAAGRRRSGGVDPAAALEPRRRALVRQRPHRLVEPVCDRARRCAAGRAGAPPAACPTVPAGHPRRRVRQGPWVFGLQHYVFLADGALRQLHRGRPRPPRHPRRAGTRRGRTARGLRAPRARLALHGRVLARAARRPDRPRRQHAHRGLAGRRRRSALRRLQKSSAGAGPILIDPAYISRPEAITFPTEGGLSAHANYYPPANPDFVAPEGELPPLLVNVHGGPTADHAAMLDLDVQYWTSRGIAVVDVNYGGSTGYGREYRERLRGEWGVVDTVDSINAARYLVARGDADPARLGVRGGSAGGYTTLNALTRFRRLHAPAPACSASPTWRRSPPAARTSSSPGISTACSGPIPSGGTSTASVRRSTTSTPSAAR